MKLYSEISKQLPFFIVLNHLTMKRWLILELERCIV